MPGTRWRLPPPSGCGYPSHPAVLSDHPAFIETAKRHLDIGDFFDLAEHIIYPAGSNGKLGGKSTGLYLAQRILRQEAERTGGRPG